MKNSKIEWTDHTFNPWIGCTKVSTGCVNCYAEFRMDIRLKKVKWGPGHARVRTSDDYWAQPLRWNKAAKAAGERHRVFCASLADVFDTVVPPEWRNDLWSLIEATPNLDWLLLTKRHRYMLDVIDRIGLPANVWLGVSVENQEMANARIPALIQIHDHIRFLSMEPLLGPVDLSPWLNEPIKPMINWVIVGGESGPRARPMKPAWVDEIHRDCAASRTPFFFKQWGGVNKSSTGRILHGQTYSEMPAIIQP